VASNQRRCLGSGLFQTLTLLLITAGLGLAGQPTDANVRDCIRATLHGVGAGCASADLDGDRLGDLAISLDVRNHGGFPSSISVHLSHGQPDQNLVLPLSRSVFGFTVRDVDGDGDLDIALTGGINETRGVFLNNGLGQFEFDLSDQYITGPNSDYSRLSAPFANDPDVWSLAGGGALFPFFRTLCSHALVRPSASVRPECSAALFRYHSSSVRIRAP
jgi:hypothetical protein